MVPWFTLGICPERFAKMRCVILFGEMEAVLDTINVTSRDNVRQAILDSTRIFPENGTVGYYGGLFQNRGDIVDSAVFIDTEAGISEEFKISARVTAEIIIT